MRQLSLIFLVCSALVGFSISMPSQNLPPLQKDASITRGELPNGISYYLVTNPKLKGFADFALVRRGMTDTLAARSELSALPHFNKTIPYKFLSRKGIGCRPEGYISYVDDATLFRFDTVPMFDAAASDTTLLMLFDIIATQPRKHAVIVSGDINASAIIEKMKVFSLMVPSRTTSYTPKAYSWVPSEETSWSFTPSDKASVEVDFRSPRTPSEQMNTIQPFISRLYSTVLGDIVKDRLKETLISRGIPVSKMVSSYSGSSDSPGDEHFVVRLEMDEDQLIPATVALSSTLAEISSKPVSGDEYRVFKDSVLKSLSGGSSNDELVRQCVANYLFGSDLALTSTKAKFFSSKNMSLEAEADLFNNYVSALLEDTDNATVRWEGKEENHDDWIYQMMFKSTWNGVATLDKPVCKWRAEAGDTTALSPDREKSKIKAIAAEPVSGGELWTFKNDMRVIYKKMATGGSFSYSMMIKGGFSSVRDLPRGEGAFFSDMMSRLRVSGLPGKDFINVLRANGVDIETRVSATDLRISGSAPSNRYALVMKALLSIANERKADPAGFEAYRKFETASMQTAVMDSLLYPDNNYTEVKTPSGLTPTTLSDAEAFFSNEFLRCGDGVIVLVGELPSEEVQKYLAKTIGGFRVSRTVSPRQASNFQLRSGGFESVAEGDNAGVNIGLAALQPLSTETYMTYRIAALYLARRLAGTMALHGFHIKMDGRFITYPKEMMELNIAIEPVPDSGLPSEVEGGVSRLREAQLAARKVIDQVFAGPVDGAELASLKSLFTNDYTMSLADPSFYADAILTRYSAGKDVLTGYTEKINGVTPDKVKAIFGAFAGGTRVEYVVNPRK